MDDLPRLRRRSGGYGVAKARRAIGAANDGREVFGPGYLDSAYQEALALESGRRGIPFGIDPLAVWRFGG